MKWNSWDESSELQSASGLNPDKFNQNIVLGNKYGVCCKCKYFTYVAYYHDREVASCSYCNDRSARLDYRYPIKICNRFEERMQLDLEDLVKIATYIEIKRKSGFIDENEVRFVDPKERKKEGESEQ